VLRTPLRLFPGAACETAAQATDCTVATATYVLLPVFGSGGDPASVTVAVLAYDPEFEACTVTVTVAAAPLASVACVHVIGGLLLHAMVGELTETNAGPVASVSVSETEFAADGPLFETVML